MRLAVQKGAFMMQQLRAWLLSLGIALLLVIVVRSFAFAIYRVPAASVLRQGDRVMVNMLAHGNYKRGQLIVFGTKKCLCEHCYAYLVSTGSGQTLVPYHDIIGPASRLFYLPF